MSRNVGRQINKAMVPQRVEDLGNRMGKIEFAVNDLISVLINAEVIEIEALNGGGHRLIPAKPKRRALLWELLFPAQWWDKFVVPPK